jgi:pimeloyl-ACP methyl ester carboxylesterase
MVEFDRDGRSLDRFWDDLVTPGEANPGELDPGTAALVRRMHALAATPPPTPTARERVRGRLNLPVTDVQSQEESPMTITMDLLQPVPIRPNGHYRTVQPRILAPVRARASSHQWVAALLTAALVLLTLAIAFGAIRSGGSGPNESGKIPAAIAPATPSPSDSPTTEGLFDVGGHKLYIKCTGSGSPTLVFLNRLDQTTAYWGEIPNAFTRQARVCVYDRANTGKSGRSPMSTAADSVADLHNLLKSAQVPGPYLLVGDNFGGLVATMYAGTYPSEVAGLVLVGPVHPWEPEVESLIPALYRQGLVDEQSSNREQVAYYQSMDQELALLSKVGDIPVAVLVGDQIAIPAEWPVDRVRAKVYEEYQRFADSFSRGTMIRLHATAYIVKTVPDQVITEVQTVLTGLQAS